MKTMVTNMLMGENRNILYVQYFICCVIYILYFLLLYCIKVGVITTTNARSLSIKYTVGR